VRYRWRGGLSQRAPSPRAAAEADRRRGLQPTAAAVRTRACLIRPRLESSDGRHLRHLHVGQPGPQLRLPDGGQLQALLPDRLLLLLHQLRHLHHLLRLLLLRECARAHGERLLLLLDRLLLRERERLLERLLLLLLRQEWARG